MNKRQNSRGNALILYPEKTGVADTTQSDH